MRSLLGFFTGICFLLSLAAFTSAEPINSGETLTGVIETTDQEDEYSFSGNAGEAVFIRVVGGFRPGVDLIDPDGRIVDSACGGFYVSAEIDGYQLQTSGDYRFLVKNCTVNPGTGSYNVSFLNLASPDGGTISSGETAARSIDHTSDLDGVSFSASAGEVVLVRLVGGFTPRLRILSSSGDVVANQGAGSGTIADIGELMVPDDGVYTAVISSARANPSSGGYNITYVKVGQPNEGAIESGTVLQNTVDPQSDLDAYNFVACAGDLLTVQASGGFHPGIRLFDSVGNLVRKECAGYGYLAEIVDEELDYSGLHTLVVANCSSVPSTGTYELSMEKTPAGITWPCDSVASTAGGDRPVSGIPNYACLLFLPLAAIVLARLRARQR